MVAIKLRDEVRIYDFDDWFYTGEVIRIDEEAGTVDVDFNDWIQRYDMSLMKEAWPEYEVRVLIPWQDGECIADYRTEAA